MSFKVPGFRCEEIKEIVVDLFCKYNICCIPISGFEIATKLGINVIPYSARPNNVKELLLEKSEDGFSVKYDNEWFIFYNDSIIYSRINNTIMHEIGHIVLDHSQESELAEAEANFFAKYALAPPVLVHKLNITSPYQIHEKFQISLEASNYAYSYYLKWLNYGSENYTKYENRLITLFGKAV